MKRNKKLEESSSFSCIIPEKATLRGGISFKISDLDTMTASVLAGVTVRERAREGGRKVF